MFFWNFYACCRNFHFLTGCVSLIQSFQFGEIQMKILQIIPALNEGGVERGALDLALYLKKEGHHPIIASQGGRLQSLLEAANIDHLTLPIGVKSWRSFYQAYRKLNEWLSENSIDVMHGRSRLPIWLGYQLAKKNKIPWVTTCHGCHSMGFGGIKKFYNRAVVTGDRVIAISQTVRSYLLNHFPDVADRIVTIPRWVDVDRFHGSISAEEKHHLKKRWLLDDDRPLVFMPARLTPKKGQHELLNALRVVQSPCDVVFMGKNDNNHYKLECQRIVAAQNRHRIHWLEPQENIHEWYACADVVVAASQKPEPFGRIPLEAAASGVWAIAPGHGGFCESIRDGLTGSLYAPGKSEDLGRKIEESLGCDASVKTLRDHALSFSRDRMCGDLVKIYEKILA